MIVRRAAIVKYAATAGIGRIAGDGAVRDGEGAVIKYAAAAAVLPEMVLFSMVRVPSLNTPPPPYCLRWCCY